MSETPKKLVVDLSKPKGERQQYIELTAEEIAEREALAIEAEAQRVAEEQAQAELEATRASAKQKLIAGEPLTEAEADTLVL